MSKKGNSNRRQRFKIHSSQFCESRDDNGTCIILRFHSRPGAPSQIAAPDVRSLQTGRPARSLRRKGCDPQVWIRRRVSGGNVSQEAVRDRHPQVIKGKVAPPRANTSVADLCEDAVHKDRPDRTGQGFSFGAKRFRATRNRRGKGKADIISPPALGMPQLNDAGNRSSGGEPELNAAGTLSKETEDAFGLPMPRWRCPMNLPHHATVYPQERIAPSNRLIKDVMITRRSNFNSRRRDAGNSRLQVNN